MGKHFRKNRNIRSLKGRIHFRINCFVVISITSIVFALLPLLSFKEANMEKEIWKDIPGYEGLYQVSSLGRVKSLEKEVFMQLNNCMKTLKEKIRVAHETKRGYRYLYLTKDNKRKLFKVSKLVAMAFLNHKPDGTQKLVVNHINSVKNDDRLSNLEVITQRENANKKHLKSRSKYTGVSISPNKKKWASKIFYNKRLIHLGYFKNEYDAHLAYEGALTLIKKANL